MGLSSPSPFRNPLIPARREVSPFALVSFLFALILAAAPILFARSQESSLSPPVSLEDTLGLMPVPSSIQFNSGRLAVAQEFSVALSGRRDPVLDRAVSRFFLHLSQLTGMPFSAPPSNPSMATFVVEIKEPARPVLQLGDDESYVLDVDSSHARLTAPTTLGALHGLQTFLQLVQISPGGYFVPAVHIEDQPRFPWRGLMIDSSRHFIPLTAIERNLDAMEAVKLNVFHWHLSDNQGFRVESKTFPKLQELGSDGLYYTQDQVREVIAYARDRGIRVVPEFDMPGHTTAWFVGYPQLASAPGPYSIERQWGIFDPAMDPTRDSTYKFLEKFLAEMTRLFPDAFFHIGGDEVNGKQWAANPAIQSFMKAHGLNDTLALQHYFNARVEKILRKDRKIPIGWDEILAPGLPNETVIQSWRGQDSLAQAARLGYRGILSSGYYLDLMWPASQHYAVDPLAGGAASLSPGESRLILGGEACLWTEFVSPENVDSRIWPRTAAIAERLWSPQSVQNIPSMYRRLLRENWRLSLMGSQQITAQALMLDRLAGPGGSASLQILAGVVEPVKGYSREEIAAKAGIKQTSADPLNRLVDAIPPESETAREFAADVDALVASGFADPAVESRLRVLLQSWQANDVRLEPLLAGSFLLKELSPLSKELSDVAAAGLAALDAAARHEPLSQAQLQQWSALLVQSQKPQADLLLMVAPSVQKLLSAEASVKPANQGSSNGAAGK